jgi:hypothetical protein
LWKYSDYTRNFIVIINSSWFSKEYQLICVNNFIFFQFSSDLLMLECDYLYESSMLIFYFLLNSFAKCCNNRVVFSWSHSSQFLHFEEFLDSYILTFGQIHNLCCIFSCVWFIFINYIDFINTNCINKIQCTINCM